MDPPTAQEATAGSRVWLPGIVECIASFLSANIVACVLRLVHKATSRQFADRKTLRLSLPSPAEVFVQRWGSPDAFRGLTGLKRLKLLCLTAASGSIANLEVALANAGLLLTGEVLEAAAEAGQLHVCKLLQERGCPWGVSDPPAAAARGGHRHVCEWLLDSGCPCSSYAMYAAARGGHEGLMRWLHQLLRERDAGFVDVGRLLQDAAAGLSLAALQRLHQQLLAGQQQQQGGRVQTRVLNQDQKGRILAAAAGSPTPDWRCKVEWLEGLGYCCTVEVCVEASKSPDDAVGRLQWLHTQGYPLSQEAADQAATHGDLASLCFLMEQLGVWPTDRASVLVAADGHLTVLQYLHASGFPMDAPAVAGDAAREGHLPVVVWAVEVLGGVTPVTAAHLLDDAARTGNVQLMTWLRGRGWLWSDRAIRITSQLGCEEALEWLVEQGCPLPEDGVPYMLAADSGDRAMLRCLQRLGCPWDLELLPECITRAVPVRMLQCLVELGCPVDWITVEETATEVYLEDDYRADVLEWLEWMD